MPKFVSNTSPILYLSKIGLIDKIYLPHENFIIPNGVKEEVFTKLKNTGFYIDKNLLEKLLIEVKEI